MSFAKIAELNHELLRISHIDRDTFFGRMDILEYFAEKTHAAQGKPWRKLCRYGNIVEPKEFLEALKLCRDEAQFTPEEFRELQSFIKHEATSYGSPDCAVASVMIEVFLQS